MADSRRPGPSRPSIRLRPAPLSEPPYADEAPDLWPRPAGQLALDLFGAAHQPAGRPAGRRHDPRPPSHPGRPPLAALVTATPEATRAAHRFVGTCLEILNGYRPPGQLRALVAPGRVIEVTEQLAQVASRTGPVRRRATRPTLHLRRLRVCEPRPAAVEVAAVLASPGRSWAMAVRLEHRAGTWLCTVLQVL
ncbi:Rv3235 family protein [Micromonospora sp. KC721]|uniref:Rv3235 family protein n=1 Tax=Micromonospora sp. KC721 TaxID=2530380 RepID=UPI00104C1353|nr:Rv3235 family protein [Micromonospora sp. KC721]TDB73736.1 hypothetical protein E1182_20495 [Micromonospora sp. KC721]